MKNSSLAAVALVFILRSSCHNCCEAFSVHRSTTSPRRFACTPNDKRCRTCVRVHSFSRETATNKDNVDRLQLLQRDDMRPPPWGRVLHQKITSALVATMLMTATVLIPWQVQVVPAGVETTTTTTITRTVSIQPAQALALTDDQLLVADVWKEVTRQYFDKTYNGLGEEGWKQKRLEAVKAVATNVDPSDNKEQVYAVIRNMLSFLGDPYTRFLTPDQYDSLTSYARGSNAGGIGVSLILDPASGRVVVVNVTPDGPAAKGGVLPGDVIVQVDGLDMQDTKSATAELVAAKCRGQAGSLLNIAVRHGGNGGGSSSNIEKAAQLTLTRAKIKVNPVQVSTLTLDNNKKKKVGLLKVTAFSQETTAQIIDALREVKDQRVMAIVMDLRGNAGGYMPAGVDTAKLFLSPQSRIVSEVDKSGRTTIYIADAGVGTAEETQLPLYLLVDQRTASAAEIIAAALQDNHRALILGSSKTFGKGRIQNVQPLQDGSGVAVTKAKYITPAGKDIHGVGITPDRMLQTCGPDDSVETCLAGVL